MIVKQKSLFDEYPGRRFCNAEYQARMELDKLDRKDKYEEQKLNESNIFCNESEQKTQKEKKDLNLNSLARLNEGIRMKVITEAFNNLFVNALPLDENVKIHYENNFKSLTKQKLKTYGKDSYSIYKTLSEKSNYLNGIIDLCESVSEKLFSKSSEKLKNENEEIDNDKINDEINTMIVDTSKDIDMDDVSEKIKEKVINVIKTENEESVKTKQMIEDINSAKEMNESVILYNKNKVQDYSLFKSLMINNYKRILSESKKYDIGMYGYKNEETNEVKVNMDMTLSESIVNYTLLETYNTIKADKYSIQELKTIAHNIAYENIK